MNKETSSLSSRTKRSVFGSMPEWLMGADCKSAGNAYAGSNPARPNTKITPFSFRRRGERKVAAPLKK